MNAVCQNIKDTLKLPEFEIKSNYIIDNHGFKRVDLDSITLVPHITADLSTLLSEYSTIFVKSYGNGTLATPSFRGTTSQHTQVQWNGINLNSPMLGQIDLSQVPVAQFEKIEILYGASGIALTSGAFGGVINLVTIPNWNNRINLMMAQTIASFDNYTSNANIAVGNGNIQSHTKINYSSGLNDFPYFNDYLGESVCQKNAKFKQYDITQEFYWKLKDKHLFSARVWYRYDDRNLPPTTDSDQDKIEKQKDKILRALLEYKYIERKYNLMIHTSMSDQYMKYTNQNQVAEHHVYSWINRVRFTYTGIRNLSIKPGLDFNHDWAVSDGYDGIKTRNTASFFGEIAYDFSKKIKSTLVFREEIIDGKFMPLISTVGIEYKPFNKINFSISSNLARNFRFPTLNELYWDPGGNPELKPELDYILEGGVNFNIKSKNRQFFLETTFSGYYSWIYDMIVWVPMEDNSSLWSPENVNEVMTRGIELGLNMQWKILGFDLGFKNNYTLNHSTYEKSGSINDQKVGKQLIYAPVNAFNSVVSLEKWNVFLRYNFIFVGKRYTSTDNLFYMPAYTLSNIILGKNINLRYICLTLQVEIKNLFDLDYQSIRNRPMPGVNYAFTMKISFGKGNR